MTTSKLSAALSKGAGVETAKAPRPELRRDFQTALERKLEGWLGLPGTPQRTKIENLASDMLGEPDNKGLRHFDLDKLGAEKLLELKRLEKASEDFEAVLVKGMLSQMRRTSFTEESGAMGDLARDFLDQAVAESVARSKSTVGIAKTVFVDMAQKVVNTVDLTTGPADTGDTHGKED